MKIHLIAIGGAAMHNLAIALKKNGHTVSGSDDEIFEPSRSRLAKYGLLPEKEGWHPESITGDIDVVILGMHARADNPELIKAQNTGLKIYSYPQYLYNHSINKKRVVIGGSHGKTTITAMVMHVLKYYNKNFDYLVGSQLKDFEVMVRLSDDAPVMIFEGDEYLSSPLDRRPKFHWYHPHIALLSGIAWDHINVFPSYAEYKNQFAKFIELIEKNGTLVYNNNDKELSEIVKTTSNNDLEFIPYNISKYKIVDGVVKVFSGEKYVPLKIFGKHNMQNLKGAQLVCSKLGISENDFYNAIKNFEGAANRLELVFKQNGFLVFKDFAHAPSKLKATIDAVAEQFAGKPVTACFELHTFSSLNENFLSQYSNTMDNAHKACVYFNPHALKMKRLKNLNKKQIKNAFNKDDLNVFDNDVEMQHWIKENISADSVLLMMSSGNFNGLNIKNFARQLLNA